MQALIAVVGLASLVAFATVGYAMWPSGLWKERKKREPMPLWVKLAAIGVLLAVMMAAFTFVVATGGHREFPRLPGTQRTTTTLSFKLNEPLPASKPTEPLDVAWWVAAGSVVLAAAMAVGLVLLSKGRRWGQAHPVAEPDPDTTVAMHAVDTSIDALVHEVDARTAVIAAYVSMERALAECGIPRPPWETPFEYVDRILMRLGATADTAARLTELFEEAKFSSHPVGPEMKDAALDALTTLRLELVAAA